MRTRDVLKTVGAIAAVAALTGASAVPAGPAPVALPDEAALHEQLWSAPASARSAPSAATATELDLGAAKGLSEGARGGYPKGVAVPGGAKPQLEHGVKHVLAG